VSATTHRRRYSSQTLPHALEPLLPHPAAQTPLPATARTRIASRVLVIGVRLLDLTAARERRCAARLRSAMSNRRITRGDYAPTARGVHRHLEPKCLLSLSRPTLFLRLPFTCLPAYPNPTRSWACGGRGGNGQRGVLGLARRTGGCERSGTALSTVDRGKCARSASRTRQGRCASRRCKARRLRPDGELVPSERTVSSAVISHGDRRRLQRRSSRRGSDGEDDGRVNLRSRGSRWPGVASRRRHRVSG